MVVTKAWIVSGMTCEGCAHTVEKVLSRRLPDATAITADHRTGTVRIDSATEVEDNAVREVVERAGYDFVGAV